MYASVSRNVSREEWMWRGLAIAICLAMVGMAVMPLLATPNLTTVDLYFAMRNNNKAEWCAFGISAGWETSLTLLEYAVVGEICFPAAVIMWTPILIE